MFKVLSIHVLLIVTIFKYGNSSAIREQPRSAVLERYEEINRNTILNERDSYSGIEKMNVVARELELAGGKNDRRRLKRDESFESADVVRRPDSEYQAVLGPDFILPDNWRSLYSSAGLRKLSPCSS